MNEQIIKELAISRNKFIEVQKELKEQRKFFCPKCYTMTTLSEKYKGKEVCRDCMKEYFRKRHQRLKMQNETKVLE